MLEGQVVITSGVTGITSRTVAESHVGSYWRLQENFGRINLWSWVDYDRVVYIDADCLVVGSIGPLLMLPTYMLGAVGA